LSSVRGYSLPDPPPSPDAKAFYRVEEQHSTQQLVDLLTNLPKCPKVVLREIVEVAALEGLTGGDSGSGNTTGGSVSKNKNIMIELDWVTAELVLTTDGFLHILKTNGFENPIKSFNIKVQ
jgi:hypothetical protein